jgi:hypothetical protein
MMVTNGPAKVVAVSIRHARAYLSAFTQSQATVPSAEGRKSTS